MFMVPLGTFLLELVYCPKILVCFILVCLQWLADSTVCALPRKVYAYSLQVGTQVKDVIMMKQFY